MIIDTPATEPEAAPYFPKREIVLLTAKEVASRWRITTAKVNQMRVASQLMAIRLPSGTFRYDLEEILRFEEPVPPNRQIKKARSAAETGARVPMKRRLETMRSLVASGINSNIALAASMAIDQTHVSKLIRRAEQEGWLRASATRRKFELIDASKTEANLVPA